MVLASEASVAVHHECDVLGYRALSKSADEKLAQLTDSPGDWWRVCEPSGDAVFVDGGHGGWLVEVYRWFIQVGLKVQ
jgi:hypothetical protein